MTAELSRAELRVAAVASGLLMLLDEHGITGRLPQDARIAASGLRHTVKLAVQASAGGLTPPADAEPGAAFRAFLRSQPWAQPDPGPPGFVYLLCFRDPNTGQHRPLRGNGCRGQYAGHYWGWTEDLVRRIVREHRNPRWAGPGRLVQVALAAGLTFELAYVEYPATRGRERRLKNQGGAARRCPLCRGTAGPLDPFQVAAASDPTLGGRR
jgi:hypothetical protein